MTSLIYEVWAFYMVLTDTGISQAGIVMLPGNETATDNYELCIYHTTCAASLWPTPSNPTQLPIGGNMKYKGKIFGADIEPFKRICKTVQPRAIEAGVTLMYGSDWIDVWEDHMNCADVSHILFDRPIPDYSWPSLSTSQSCPISPRPTSFDFDPIPYGPREEHFPNPERRFEYGQERGSHKRDMHHTHKERKYRHDNFPVEYDDSEDSDSQEYKSASNRRHHRRHDHRHDHHRHDHRYDSRRDHIHDNRREREYTEEESDTETRPVPKKYKYASLIAENVTANAVGDIFTLLFESALGAIF